MMRENINEITTEKAESIEDYKSNVLDGEGNSGRKFLLQVEKATILANLRKAIIESENEEEVKEIFLSGYIKEKVLDPLGLNCYTSDGYIIIYSNDQNASYKKIIILCKSPGELATIEKELEARKQMIDYIVKKIRNKEEWDKCIGIIISDRIIFLVYDKNKSEWVVNGRYDLISRDRGFSKFMGAIRSLRKKALKIENIIEDFGFKSDIAKKAISLFYEKIINGKNKKLEVFFDEWLDFSKKRYNKDSFKEISKLAINYGIIKDANEIEKVNSEALFYAIQTYYAIILKLLAIETIYAYEGHEDSNGSYAAIINDKYIREGVEALKEILVDIESGYIFKKYGYRRV
ncbi:MAG: hypothetical protein QXW71_02715 [Thermoplasmata archaeon]